MTATDRSRALAALLSKLRASTPPKDRGTDENPWPGDPLLREFLRSFLMWESTAARAASALARMESEFVDLNEFRVSLIAEMAGVLGAGSGKGEERMGRLKLALNEIFKREHALRLSSLALKPKRESWTYLAELPGTPTFVAARTFVVGLGGHAFPIDERLRVRLVSAGVLESETTLEEAATQLERACKAGGAEEAHTLLQAWSDSGVTVVVTRSTRAKAPRPAASRVVVSAKKRSPATVARPAARKRKA